MLAHLWTCTAPERRENTFTGRFVWRKSAHNTFSHYQFWGARGRCCLLRFSPFFKKNPSIKIFPLDPVFGYSNEFRPLLLTWPKTRKFKNTFERPLGILHSEPLKTRMQQTKRTHSEASCLFVQTMPRSCCHYIYISRKKMTSPYVSRTDPTS